jgi:hypothetical protein
MVGDWNVGMLLRKIGMPLVTCSPSQHRDARQLIIPTSLLRWCGGARLRSVPTGGLEPDSSADLRRGGGWRGVGASGNSASPIALDMVALRSVGGRGRMPDERASSEWVSFSHFRVVQA